jgi:hypothetical protein
MKTLQKIKISVSLLTCVTILVSVQSLAQAQGARFGYTATDLDSPGSRGNRVYRIDLDNPGNTVQMGLTNVDQELEGFFSVDGPTNSRLYGAAEPPDGTSTGGSSIIVDLTAAACNPGGLGVPVCQTGIVFGTEVGAAWDHTTSTTFLAYSDDLNLPAGTNLYIFNLSSCMPILISTNLGIYVDGLAVGGDGTLYASDARVSDSLYRFNFDDNAFEIVGAFGISLAEDSGLANFRGVSGLETNLYMITEGDGPNLGRLWSVSATTGAITLVGELRLAGSGVEVPEDLEGFDIPWRPLACN